MRAKFPHALRILALSLWALWLASCSGSSSVSGRLAQAPDGLLPWPAAHSGSRLSEYLLHGSSAESHSSGAVVVGSAMELASSAGGFEYALYRFNPAELNSGPLDSLAVLLEETPEGGIWLALANWDRSCWDWQQLQAQHKTFAVDEASFCSPLGDMWVAIAAADGGSATVNALSVRTLDPDNQAPLAHLAADVSGGNAPLTVNFDAGLSADPDGSIIEYAWDLDADGGYEVFTDGPLFTHTYTSAGLRSVKLRVTDDQLARASTTLDINVNVPGNAAPIAVLESDVATGTAPLSVDFDAAASSDSDGSILRYDWDLDADGIWEIYDGGPQQSHTFTVAGDAQARLRVTDDAAAQDTASITISVNAVPIASFIAVPVRGQPGQTIQLNAGASSDPDGSLVEYLWDLDGNGTFEASSGSSSTTQKVLPDTPGRYTVGLRVVDDDEASADTTRLITAQGWVVSSPNPDSSALVGQYISIALVNGCPAMSYHHYTNTELRYVRASNPEGSAWGEPVILDAEGSTGWYTSIEVVNGRPAISYYDASNLDLRYVRAADSNGDSWGSPVTPDGGNVGQYTSLEVVNGCPAISYYEHIERNLLYVRANDADGSSWGTPLTVDSTDYTGWYNSMAIVNGKPAIAYSDDYNKDVRFVRASDANGSTWGAPQIADGGESVGYSTCLALVNGCPAISYHDGYLRDLKYVRATDANGSNWGTPQTVDSTGDVGSFNSLAVVGGVPAIAYYDTSNTALKYVQANGASGNSWGSPETIDEATAAGYWASLLVVAGEPSVGYYDDSFDDLKYIKLY